MLVHRSAARFPRGFLIVEIACAMVVIVMMVSILAVAVAHIAVQRRAILHHAIGQQVLANVLEEIDSWPAGAATSERLRRLALPTWAAQQLPRAELRCRSDAAGGSLASARITVSVAWREAPQRSESRVQAVLWKSGGDQESPP